MTKYKNLFTVVFSACILLCCDPKLDLPSIDKEGKRVKIGTDMDVEICEGTVVKLDAFVEAVESVLQLPKRKGKIGIYIIQDPDRSTNLCPNDGYSCYIPEERGGPAVIVVADDYTGSVFHEIVHDLHNNSAIGRPPDFVAEGIATAWGDEGTGDTNELSLDDLLSVFDKGEFTHLEASQAARFVRYLVDKYSPQLLVKWAKGLYWDNKASKIKSVFQKVYGVSMDDEWALFGGGEAFPSFARCMASVVPWQDDYRLKLIFDADCSSLNVHTNFDDPSSRIVEAVVKIPEEQDYFVEYSLQPIEQQEEVNYLKCDATDLDAINRDLHSYYMPLEYGEYILQKEIDVESETAFDLTIRKPPEPAYCDAWVQDCEQGQKCQLIESLPYVRVDCAPMAEDPFQEGEPCEPPSLPNGDACDMGLERQSILSPTRPA